MRPETAETVGKSGSCFVYGRHKRAESKFHAWPTARFFWAPVPEPLLPAVAAVMAPSEGALG